jgi:uncharacterized protein YndB with AHSA1/START domain
MRWLFLALLCSACGPSLEQLRPIAASKQLQPDAPVKAEASIDIDAPLEKVWAVFSDVERWPQWNSDAPNAHLEGPLAPGTRLTYGSHKLELACVEPPTAMTFYGTLAGYKGVTVWKLVETAPGKTRVTAAESNDGFLISVFYSAAQLEEHLHLWLNALKKSAEGVTAQ